jgi:hypothetical protein
MGGIGFSFVCFQSWEPETLLMALLGGALCFRCFHPFYTETPRNVKGMMITLAFFVIGIVGTILMYHLLILNSVSSGM